MTAKQAAERLGCSERTIKYWLRSGRLQGRKRPTPNGWAWSITAKALSLAKANPRSKAGYPLGRKRKGTP